MGDAEGAEVTSTQNSLSSTHDPGWNDPPKWAFTPPQTSCTTPTKRILNKRVAFPLNSAPTASNSQSQSPVSLPPNLPPPASCKSVPENPEIVLSKVELENSDSNSPLDKEKALNETLVNLEAVIEKHLESTSKAQEVQKRIETMKTLWLEDKLDDCIFRKVFDISKALKEEDVEKADKIHISLMMERATLCSSWIPGIRHLILEMKCKFASDQTNSESGPSLISLSLEESANFNWHGYLVSTAVSCETWYDQGIEPDNVARKVKPYGKCLFMKPQESELASEVKRAYIYTKEIERGYD